jgi:nicotinamide-nucleotide amidase
MIAEIIAAGSEMLTPFRQDTNSLYLTEVLNDLGVQVAFKTIVGDNIEHLTGAARIALGRADIVIFSGGLGPTEDDLTREAAAAALELPLFRDPNLLDKLAERFAARNIPMPPNNAKQADVLQGATILDNKNGSAAGQYHTLPLRLTQPAQDRDPAARTAEGAKAALRRAGSATAGCGASATLPRKTDASHGARA